MAEETGGSTRSGKIDWLDNDIYTVFPAKRGGELFHWLTSSGREHEIDFLRRQQFRKFEAEPFRTPRIGPGSMSY